MSDTQPIGWEVSGPHKTDTHSCSIQIWAIDGSDRVRSARGLDAAPARLHAAADSCSASVPRSGRRAVGRPHTRSPALGPPDTREITMTGHTAIGLHHGGLIGHHLR